MNVGESISINEQRSAFERHHYRRSQDSYRLVIDQLTELFPLKEFDLWDLGIRTNLPSLPIQAPEVSTTPVKRIKITESITI